MVLKDFIGKVADQFDNTSMDQLNAGTEFKKLEDWSSLTALSIMSMIDEEYGVMISGEDIAGSSTIQDLFNSVNSKIEA